MPILQNLFQKTEAEGTLPNSFYEASITLTPKTKRLYNKEKLQTKIFHEHRSKNPQQNISKLNPAVKRSIHHK